MSHKEFHLLMWIQSFTSYLKCKQKIPTENVYSLRYGISPVPFFS